MFDTIEDELFCPFCGKKNKEFQTKDLANLCSSWKIEEIIQNCEDMTSVEIHDECKHCKKWISINLDIRRLKLSQNRSSRN